MTATSPDTGTHTGTHAETHAETHAGTHARTKAGTDPATDAGTDAGPAGFAARIRAATADAHRGAERSPYLGALVSGQLPLADYGRLVVQHRAIYAAIEAANAAMASDGVAAAFVDDGIERLPALDRDLHAVLGPDWRSCDEATLVPATREYVARIEEVAARWPAGWVGHHYVRYLGDLSGGLFLRGAIERAYGIDASSGTAFYDFPNVPDPDAWKQAYRSALDDAPWSADEQDRIIDEILAAYDWNTRLLEELG